MISIRFQKSINFTLSKHIAFLYKITRDSWFDNSRINHCTLENDCCSKYDDTIIWLVPERDSLLWLYVYIANVFWFVVIVWLHCIVRLSYGLYYYILLPIRSTCTVLWQCFAYVKLLAEENNISLLLLDTDSLSM